MRLDDRAAVVRSAKSYLRSCARTNVSDRYDADDGEGSSTRWMRQIFGRSRVVTTGSGGKPYTSGLSSSKKNAPAPPIPSSASRRYRLASWYCDDRENLLEPCVGPRAQFVEVAELDRFGRTRFGAGRRLVVLQAVVAQRAFRRRGRPSRACRSRRMGRPERSSRSHCRRLAGRRPCRTRCGSSAPVGQTSRHAACVQCLQTSDSMSQRPATPPGMITRRRRTRERLGCQLLDERDVPPGGAVEFAGVVVRLPVKV